MDNWPLQVNAEGQWEQSGGPQGDQIEYPPGAKAIAAYLADRLAYLTHGLAPELKEVSDGSPDQFRV